MWIAPELKGIMANKPSLKQSLVPNQILNSLVNLIIIIN